MNYLNQFFLLSCLVYGATGVATTPKFIQKHVNRLQKMDEAPRFRQLAPQCTDFSGNWKGKCVDQEGEVSEETFKIEQKECKEISWDGLTMPLNGSATIGSTPNPLSGDWPFKGTIANQWNDSQTRLKFMVSADLMHGAVAFIGNHQFRMQGSQLIKKDTFATDLISFDGPSGWTSITETCAFDLVESD